MFVFSIWVFLLFVVETFVASEHCRASSLQECATYALSLEASVLANSKKIHLDDIVIGSVAKISQPVEGRVEAQICIEKYYQKHIERGTIAYVHDGKISIYNVWASGERLPEHSTIQSFSSRLDLYLYEVKSIAFLLLRYFGWGPSQTKS
ncbi:hypothetical protein [Solidesulfovibrio sp. C21]|uniref:hypothetical protein n=1 Tax=Solidesulfovibrio sp. C21 TaxID=3398613 RepID=UPI0039FDC0DB